MQTTQKTLQNIVPRYGTQKEFAERCGVGETVISRIISAKIEVPSPEIIGKICEKINEPDAALLAKSYYREFFPESIRLLLSGRPRNSARVEETDDDDVVVPVEEVLDHDLALLRQKAVHDKDVRHWLHLSARTISGTPGNAEQNQSQSQ